MGGSNSWKLETSMISAGISSWIGREEVEGVACSRNKDIRFDTESQGEFTIESIPNILLQL